MAKQFLRWTYNIIRLALVSVIAVPLLACAVGYLLISMPAVQQKLKAEGEKQLSELLGTQVTIDGIDFVPFNRVTLTGVNVPDQSGNHLFDIKRLSAGINVRQLLANGKIVIDYASIDGLSATITRPDKDSPTNMQFIIDAFKPKEEKPPKPFELAIDKVAIRRSNASYDVLNAPRKAAGMFDPNHLAVTGITLDAVAPRIKNDDFVVELQRLALAEKSGLTINNITANVAIDSTTTTVKGLKIELPGTTLKPQDMEFHYSSLKNAVKEVAAQPFTLNISDNTVTPSDFKCFAPQLAQFNEPIDITAALWTDKKDIDVRLLDLKTRDSGLALKLMGRFNNINQPSQLSYNVPLLSLRATPSATGRVMSLAGTRVPEKARQIIAQCGTMELDAQAKGTLSKVDATIKAATALGKVTVKGDFDKLAMTVNATVNAQDVNLAAITGKSELLGMAQGQTDVKLNLSTPGKPTGHVNAALDYLDLRGRRYHNLTADAELSRGNYRGTLSLHDPAAGTVELKADASIAGEHSTLVADISAKSLNLAALGITSKWADRSITADMRADLQGNSLDNLAGNITLADGRFTTREGYGVHLEGLKLADIAIRGPKFASVTGDVAAKAVTISNREGKSYEFRDIELSDINLHGTDLDRATGNLAVGSLAITKGEERGFHFENLHVGVNADGNGKRIDLNSDFLNGYITGRYNYKTIVPALRAMATKVMPELPDSWKKHEADLNQLEFHFEVEPNDEFESYMSTYATLPVKLLYRATVDGHVDTRSNSADAKVSLPYLQQGKNIIEGTTLNVALDSATNLAKLDISTLIPNKKGNIALFVTASGAGNKINTNVGWMFKRERDYHGDINLTATMGRGSHGQFTATVDVNPTAIVVNDTVWNVEKGSVHYDRGAIVVNDIMARCDEQFINLNGKLSKDPGDVLNLTLQKIHLDYIFETLKINHVDFGGIATGRFDISDVFSGRPRMETKCLHVDDLHYNGALMGDADIESHWEPDEMAVELDCDLSQSNGRHSHIFGEIFTTRDSLHLTFDADRANVKFMKPFMKAFTDDVSGWASGHAVLFGNFKTIDLYGDVYAEDLKLRIGYTNVDYSCTDSVHIVPGWIEFKDITINDRDGHTGKLNGWLKHDSFHDPSFNFTITDAQDLLCYDITPAMNDLWYGTIYGNGSAIVSGEPGTVKIGVNMESAERSKFTFVLSDAEQAAEYSFLTFRDRDAKNAPPKEETTDNGQPADSVPEIVRQLAQRNEQKNTQPDVPTLYSIDLQAEITPEAQLTLIMDPTSGDKIKAYGNGNLRLTYGNIDDNFEMFGKYTLEKGSYNFTLQDIIIKDFTIRDGSSISFNGDPYNAILDINAVYSLTANLSDLDQSFATDRDINRTTVPVNALLNVKGEIDQPELSFDLEFPSLSSDAYRKVKSVINTDEMMNRQIIYLLALNRFYTPNYMAQSNESQAGSQLTAVASSTIASQLSSMLGQLSENWSIAPNVRSDKGDFSDVEIDLALSSQLLNNRLLLNGNFGYRDNTYNTRNSNFIGDFDLQYLLNRKGTLRLKAYNHFNDQNYYVRNAMTTQGVGVMVKHDFDNLLRWRSRKKDDDNKADTTASGKPKPKAAINDSTDRQRKP